MKGSPVKISFTFHFIHKERRGASQNKNLICLLYTELEEFALFVYTERRHV